VANSKNAAEQKTKTEKNTTAVNAAVDIAKQILTILSTLMTAISAFYFGAKTSTDSAKKGGEIAAAAAGVPAVKP
jgi:hypothetical protein